MNNTIDEELLIGLELDKALNILQAKGKNVVVVYNNSNKLKNFDSQLVVAYKEEQNSIKLIVSNFKIEV